MTPRDVDRLSDAEHHALWDYLEREARDARRARRGRG
jgi:hypothetical protein